eukprot:TRINITY_DN14213_c0_g1_i3.p1 TRINITY_DN14213_c0_g1~~TRINITY_DN14213_c0_g1_i3.p1  ORF type:complete len:125 (-),score=14.50 TRINITY_DN14213_c0_g1_i3:38-412(-)
MCMLEGDEKFWPSSEYVCKEFEVPKIRTILTDWLELEVNQNLLLGRGLGVYPLGTLMNHNCHPNVDLKRTRDARLIEWVSTRDITEGEELTITYVDVSLPCSARQRYLLSHHLFSCPCDNTCKQ